MATPMNNTHTIFAVKSVLKEKLKRDLVRLQQELILLRDLDHPNIVKFYQTFEDGYKIHFVMEYCSGGSLEDHVARRGLLSEKRVARIMANAFSAVSYLHSKGIVHRDIKEGNFLMSDKSADAELKLIDFGLAQIMNPEERLVNRVGTPIYMAPEVFQGNYDQRCDYWSLGVMMYVLLSGQYPIDAPTSAELSKVIKTKEIKFEGDTWAEVSTEAKELCKALLTRDPAKRISAAEALEHPWVESAKKVVQFEPEKIAESLANLKTFAKKKKFIKEALRVSIVFLEDKHLKPLKELFNFFDYNEEGEITPTTLKTLGNKYNVQISDEDIEEILNNINAPSVATSIRYTDFIVANVDPKIYSSKDKLWGLFKHFDSDNSGTITIANMREEMARSGRRARSDEIDEILSEVCADPGGMDFDTFSYVICGSKPPTLVKQNSKRKV